MKNLVAANYRDGGKASKDELDQILKAQIENSLELGWKKKDLIVITNFPFSFMSVKARVVDLNKSCLTGTKMYAVREVFNNGEKDVVWAHDLDAWQSHWFDCPDFLDAGAAEYSKPKFNGGSVFWKPTAIDIIDKIISIIEQNEHNKEEPTINEIFKSDEYKDRITTLNYTYNVGCSGFTKRMSEAIKPIKVCHLHPTNRIAWETHALDRNGTGEVSVSERLEKLLRKYYPNLATELSLEGKNKLQINRLEKELEKLYAERKHLSRKEKKERKHRFK